MIAKPYRPNGVFRPTFRALRSQNSAETVRKTAEDASKRYTDFMQRHKDLNLLTRMHYGQCCERAALYLTLKEHYPDTAMELIDLSVREYCGKIGIAVNRCLKLPAFRKRFFRIMIFMAMNVFGKNGGFNSRKVSVTDNEGRFDVLKCPYCRFLSELGCPELTANFCKSDEYSYGSLDGIAFERTQSLGMGGTKCDFCMRRK
ncbi:MAG: L-2-amino-thiazoline-4-carboxylic acid hydrolase [Ruminococcus sp.]|nr:L-2-amino-thiazoline-4-carboxylic acid hydrolase [Ruminococcus sp.]